MLAFNTSTFDKVLSAPDCGAQWKAIVAPFDEFDAKPDVVLQHITCFTQWCEETGMIEDFPFIEIENPPPSIIDMDGPTQKAAWLVDSRCLTYGNILINSSTATMQKIQAAHD